MVLSLLLTSDRTKTSIEGLELDATISESHEALSEITDETLEVGTSIADHIVTLPDRLTIEGVVTNAPIRLFGFGFEPKAQRAFDFLLDLRRRRQLVTVVTAYRVYDDMGILNLQFNRDRSTGDALRFTIQLTKIERIGSLQPEITNPDAQALDIQSSREFGLGRLVTNIATPLASSAAAGVLGSIF